MTMAVFMTMMVAMPMSVVMLVLMFMLVRMAVGMSAAMLFALRVLVRPAGFLAFFFIHYQYPFIQKWPELLDGYEFVTSTAQANGFSVLDLAPPVGGGVHEAQVVVLTAAAAGFFARFPDAVSQH